MVLKRTRDESSATPDAARREGRIRRHLRLAGEVGREPKRAFPLLRSAFLDAWRLRGGGLFGLGYVVTFVYLEIDVLVSEAAESTGVSDFALGQLIEYLLRVSLLSFVNMFQALLWPFYVLQHLGWVGIILLVAGYFAFEYGLKPLAEERIPELRKPASRHTDQ